MAIDTHELLDLSIMAELLSRKLDGCRVAVDMRWEDADGRLIEATRLATEISNILHERTEGRAL